MLTFRSHCDSCFGWSSDDELVDGELVRESEGEKKMEMRFWQRVKNGKKARRRKIFKEETSEEILSALESH